jgi:hypothetical protein
MTRIYTAGGIAIAAAELVENCCGIPPFGGSSLYQAGAVMGACLVLDQASGLAGTVACDLTLRTPVRLCSAGQRCASCAHCQSNPRREPAAVAA